MTYYEIAFTKTEICWYIVFFIIDINFFTFWSITLYLYVKVSNYSIVTLIGEEHQTKKKTVKVIVEIWRNNNKHVWINFHNLSILCHSHNSCLWHALISREINFCTISDDWNVSNFSQVLTTVALKRYICG